MENSSKSKWIVVNTVCIVTALACIGLTFWGNLKNNGVLTIDAYVGVMGTLIGICATIIVGFQIFSYFEFRDIKTRIKDIDKIESNLAQTIAIYDNLISNSNEQLTNILDTLAKKEGVLPFKTDLLITSIVVQIYGVSKNNITKFSQSLLFKYEKLKVIINTFPQFKLLNKPVSWDSFKTINLPENLENRDEILLIHSEVLSKVTQALK